MAVLGRLMSIFRWRDGEALNAATPVHRPVGATADYQLVFNFANTLTSVGRVSAAATGTTQPGPSTGSIDSNDAHNYFVSLTAVPNAQYITITLSNVTDSVGEFSGALSATMGVLIGDVNGSGRTDNGDAIIMRNLSGTVPSDNTTARADVNCSGRIDNGDAIVVRNNSGNILP